MTRAFENEHEHGHVADFKGKQLNIHLYSNTDDAHYSFRVPARMTVDTFIELALKRLSEIQGSERVEALKRYYEPVLEIQAREGSRELKGGKSLIEAGVYDEAVCQIAARPRKERILFCKYSA